MLHRCGSVVSATAPFQGLLQIERVNLLAPPSACPTPAGQMSESTASGMEKHVSFVGLVESLPQIVEILVIISILPSCERFGCLSVVYFIVDEFFHIMSYSVFVYIGRLL